MHQITKVQAQSTVVRMEWKKVGVMSLVSPLLQPSRELSGLTVFTRPPISKIFVKKYSLLPFDAKTQRIHEKSTKEIEMVQGFLLSLLHPFLTIPVGN